MKSRLSRPRASRGRREPFGEAGLILAVCALVLACTGGAFAAGRLTGPQKKEVGKIAAKVAKKNAGTPGPKGGRGPAGPAGPAGAPGPAGPAGTASAYGTVGVNGSTGNMVFRLNVGFPGEPTNPQPGITCIPAPKNVPVALTLQEPGYIMQVAANQCGGASNYQVETFTVNGVRTDLPFNIFVP
ncbi:MAG TPA: hypothetical protein VGC32_02040 [Solirubrobacterales bacterium]